jgi:outer membrane lipoprotein-sorting protein
MKKLIIGILIILFVPSVMAEVKGEDILKKSDDLMERSRSLSVVEMKVYRKNKLRKTYRMKMISAGIDKMLIEFVHPPRNKGEKVLKVDENIWIYRPKINKVIRISGRASFSGSDFSNTDVLSVRLDKDYIPKLIAIEDFEGQESYKLELIAKTEEVTYAKIMCWVRKKDFVPLKRVFYTISGHELKTLLLRTESNVLEGLPDTMVMSNVMEKNKKSIMQFKAYKGQQKFSDKIFRKSSLTRKR